MTDAIATRGDTSPSTPGHEQPAIDLGAVHAVVFDLDGVLTDTASLHRRAWTDVFQSLFDDLAHLGHAVASFSDADYVRLVDGELRLDGARHVLADRGIELPDGDEEDAPGAQSAHALAAAKDARYLELLATVGPRPFASSVALLRGLRRAGVPVGVVTASRHSGEVLRAAGIAELFDAVVDGNSAAAMRLAGKPSPDTFLEALVRLGADPAHSAVVEDAPTGVAAGRAGGLALVIGVDRDGVRDQLVAAGADLVVADLGELALRGRGPAEDAWHVGQLDEEPEGVRETLHTLGNGYVATRGAPAYVRASDEHYPGTYFAGVYNRATSEVNGDDVEQEAIVNAPNWLPMSFSVAGGPWLGEPGVRVERLGVRLDLRRGVLEWRYTAIDDAGRRTTVLERRIVSMADPHLAATETSIVAENWSGTVELRAELDGDVADRETLEERILAGHHLELAGTGEDGPDSAFLAVRTVQSNVVIAAAVRFRSAGLGPEPESAPENAYVPSQMRVGRRVTASVERGGRLTYEKVVALHTSRDLAISEPVLAAREAVRRAGSFAVLLVEHEHAWERLWRRAEIRIEGDVTDAQAVANLHLFHILQVASPHVVGRDIGIGARGLHGEGYLGHIFWDELFVFPALSVCFPEVVESLLGYRTRRLGAARRLALDSGHEGAMFPWQSGSDGRDETPSILYNPRSGRWMPDRSHAEHHVGLAVAYNHWQYFQATGDYRHLFDGGAETMLEVARFFSSLASFDADLGRYRIRGVMGPDEFHDGYPWNEDAGVDDNAYTNVMAAWLFTRVADVVRLAEESHYVEVLERIGWTAAESARLDDLSHRLYVPFADGVIAQFAGYERLEPIDLDAYRSRYGEIGRLDLILEAEGDTTRRYQVGKQPDVLMLFYLLSAEELRSVLGRLGYELTSETIRRSVEYYASRVTHGSTLSRVVHAWVESRLDRRTSWRDLTAALGSDIRDVQHGTTREGIHLGAMAGTLDILTRCYTGLELRADALWLNPVLPEEISRLAFHLRYRGHWLGCEIDRHRAVVEARGGSAAPITVLVQGEPYTLGVGGSITHELA